MLQRSTKKEQVLHYVREFCKGLSSQLYWHVMSETDVSLSWFNTVSKRSRISHNMAACGTVNTHLTKIALERL